MLSGDVDDPFAHDMTHWGATCDPAVFFSGIPRFAGRGIMGMNAFCAFSVSSWPVPTTGHGQGRFLRFFTPQPFIWVYALPTVGRDKRAKFRGLSLREFPHGIARKQPQRWPYSCEGHRLLPTTMAHNYCSLDSSFPYALSSIKTSFLHVSSCWLIMTHKCVFDASWRSSLILKVRPSNASTWSLSGWSIFSKPTDLSVKRDIFLTSLYLFVACEMFGSLPFWNSCFSSVPHFTRKHSFALFVLSALFSAHLRSFACFCVWPRLERPRLGSGDTLWQRPCLWLFRVFLVTFMLDPL